MAFENYSIREIAIEEDWDGSLILRGLTAAM